MSGTRYSYEVKVRALQHFRVQLWSCADLQPGTVTETCVCVPPAPCRAGCGNDWLQGYSFRPGFGRDGGRGERKPEQRGVSEKKKGGLFGLSQRP